jgi:hypothetical protein
VNCLKQQFSLVSAVVGWDQNCEAYMSSADFPLITYASAKFVDVSHFNM